MAIKMPLENDECQAYDQMLGVVVVCTQIKISQAKWDRLRMTLTWFADLVRRKQKAPRKAVLKKRGYLVYCTITYPFITPYMKSIHLSLEVYRQSKDEDGWERDQTKNEPEPMLEFA
jgi:hypothetical protein